MKRKGFTLVELLAVIVVLAIISIITIPMIGNVIEESKKKSLEQSASGLIEAASYYKISHEGVTEFVFDENKKGETIKGDKLEYKGNIEGTGKLYIDKNGDISLCLVDDKYYVYKNYNSGIYVGEVKDNSCIIGYDVLTNKYVAMLDDGTGQISNVYSKDEVNNLIDNVDSKVTTNKNEITNIKSTIETLQNNLNSYALQSSLNTTNSNLNNLSGVVGSHTEAIDNLNSNLESFFQSVSDGKALVASAITDGGISTDATATFEVMANNIRSLVSSKKIDFNVWTSNYAITPIFSAPKSGYYNIHLKVTAGGNMRIYKYEDESPLFNMDIGANQEKIATVYLSAGDTAAVWISISSGAYFSGYAVIPD